MKKIMILLMFVLLTHSVMALQFNENVDFCDSTLTTKSTINMTNISLLCPDINIIGGLFEDNYILSGNWYLEQLNITASHFYNSSTINDFSVTYNNFESSDETISTTDSQAELGLVHQNTLYDFTLESAGYVDKDYNNYNVSTSLSATLAPVTFELYNFTYPLNNSNQTGNYTGYINLTSIDNVTCSISDSRWEPVNNSYQINFSFTNTTTITGTNNTISVTCTAETGTIDTKSLRWFATTWLYLNFYDEETDLFITEPIDLQIIGESLTYSSNHTVNKSISLSGLTAGDYNLIFDSDNYTKKTYYMTLQAGLNQTINLYSFLDSLATNVIVNVYDSYGTGLEDYNVHVLRLVNGQYKLVEIGNTDYKGRTVIKARLYEPYYRFMIVKDDTIHKYTSSMEITEDLSFYINTADDISGHFVKTNNIQHTLYYDDFNFHLVYTDSTNTLSRMCLKVYKSNDYLDRELYNSSCTNTASGSIIVGIANESGVTYTAEAYAGFSPLQFFDSLTQSFEDRIQDLGAMGLVYTFLLVLIFILIGVAWNMGIALIYLPFALWATKLLYFHELSTPILSGITALSFILGYLLNKRY